MEGRISYLFPSLLNCTFLLELRIFSHLYFLIEVALEYIFHNGNQGQILYELKKMGYYIKF